MLILTRCENEKILIGKDIKITILQVKGKQIRIGIDAPKSMRIMREEVIERDEKLTNEFHN